MTQFSGTMLSDLNAVVEKVMDLNFASYAHNRTVFPKVSPARWAKIFGPTEELEKRYQESLGEYSIYDKVRDEASND